MEEGLFHNPMFVNYVSENAVAAVGHTEGHTEVERVDPQTGQKSKVCPNYNTIPCSAHQAVYQQSRNAFNFSGVPSSFVCDSSGKELFKDCDGSPQQVIDALTKAQQQIGKKPVTGSMLQKMERDLWKGDAEARKAKFAAALKLYQGVAEDEKSLDLVREKARARVTALGKQALEAVEAAKADEKKAKTQLKKLVKDLEGLDEAKQAAEAALAELEPAPSGSE